MLSFYCKKLSQFKSKVDTPQFSFSKVQEISSSKSSVRQFSKFFRRKNLLNQTEPRFPKLKRFFRLRFILPTTLLGYTLYHWHPEKTKIKIIAKQNEFNNKLLPQLSYLYDQHFWPSLYLALPILQFVGLIKLVNHQTEIVQYDEECIRLKDGGQISLSWANPVKPDQTVGTPIPDISSFKPYDPPKDNKIMFILHGLTGGSESEYVKIVVKEAIQHGYRVVVMNQRGVNNPLMNHLPYHSGRFEDLDEALNYIHKKYPDAPIAAMGFSMGGSQMIRYMGTRGSDTRIQAFVSVAPPFNVHDCIDNIKGGTYEDRLLNSYKQKNFQPHISVIEEQLLKDFNITKEDVLNAKSLKEYHSLYTVPVWGHKDVDEFFDTTTVKGHHIDGVSVPTLILRARDDPISVHKGIPFENIANNDNIVYAETGTGSHLCWVTGFVPTSWYPKPIVEFVDKVFDLKGLNSSH